MNYNLKNIFMDKLEKCTKNYNNIAVAISSGIDSHCILFGLLELNKEITAYNFRVKNNNSQDYIYAKENCKSFNIKFVDCKIPTKVNKEILFDIIYKYKRIKKTDIECIYPFYYLLPNVKEKILLTGVCADGYFGISKKAMIHYKGSLNKLNKFRKDYFSNTDFNLDKPLSYIAEDKYQIKIKSPFIDSKMLEYFLDKDWDSCNKPKQKQLFLDMFPDEFKKIKIFKHTNLQCGDSKIRELFMPLLNEKINIKKRIRVMDLYRDLYNNYFNNQISIGG